MSNNVSEFSFLKDNKDALDLLNDYGAESEDDTEWSIFESLGNGYYPRRDDFKDVLKQISEKSPRSVFRFYCNHDYGEDMWEIKDGKLKVLKKKWI